LFVSSQQNGFTALLYAVDDGHITSVQWLIQENANIEAADYVSISIVSYIVFISCRANYGVFGL
jgi:hypothetical protein